jgi:hypothetical protein
MTLRQIFLAIAKSGRGSQISSAHRGIAKEKDA